MSYKEATSKAYSAEDIQKAISSRTNKEFLSIRATAISFQVPVQTLRGRIAKCKTKTAASKQQPTRRLDY